MIKLEFILTWTSLAAETLLRMHLKARTSFNDWFWNIRKTEPFKRLLHDINKPNITTWLNWRMETDSYAGLTKGSRCWRQKFTEMGLQSTIHYLNDRQILLLCFCHLIHRKGCKKKKKEKKNSTTNWRIKDKFDIWCFIPGIFSITSQIFLKSGLFSVNFETESSLVPS